MKRCSKCKVNKPVSDFGKDKYNVDGKCSRCKECRNSISRDHTKTPEHIQWRKLHEINNYDRISKQKRDYQILHKEEISEYKRQWRIDNQDRYLAYTRTYNFETRHKYNYNRNLTYWRNKHPTIVDDTILPYESIDDIFKGFPEHTLC